MPAGTALAQRHPDVGRGKSLRFFRPFHETHAAAAEILAKTRVGQFLRIIEPIKIKVIQV